MAVDPPRAMFVQLEQVEPVECALMEAVKPVDRALLEPVELVQCALLEPVPVEFATHPLSCSLRLPTSS